MSNKPEPAMGSNSGTAANSEPTRGWKSPKKVTATVLAASLTLLSVRMVPSQDPAEAATSNGLSSFAGTVLADTTGDGNGDSGIAGVTVELVDGAGTVIATATSDAGGAYLFENIADGDYLIRETDPADHISIDDWDQLGGGTDLNEILMTAVENGIDVTGLDFVDTPLSSIAGVIESDDNGDGTGDTALVNVTVELIDSFGIVVASTFTDSNGAYLFEDVAPGDYTVREVNPAGYNSVSDTDGVNDDETAVAPLLPGTDVTGIDFVDEALPGSISGTVTDAAGAALAGVTIELLDAAGTVIATAVTDAAGMYTFADVAPGDYTVVETNPAGYTSVSDSDGNNDDQTPVTVTSDTETSGIDFVDQEDTTVVLYDVSGTVTDAAGAPLAGVTVELLDAAGAVIATATTDAAGMYTFADVAPGDYTVVETNPTGYTSVSDSDGNNDDQTPVTVADADITGVDFVDQETTYAISGTVSEDTVGGAALSGVTVELLDSNGAVIATATTDAAGMYTFADVAPGDYTVREVNPTGFTSVTDSDGTNDDMTDVTVADADIADIDFVDEEETTLVLYAISGTVSEDTVGGAAISGVTIELLDSNGAVIATATTDANGDYAFGNIAPGDYTVREVNPTGYTSVTDSDGTNDDMTNVTVADADIVDIDFVDEQPVVPGNGSIAGTITEDTIGGTPISGVTVELLDSNGVVVATATTDAAGMYTFADVAPGDYTVVETNPTGYTSVTDSDGTNDDETAVTVAADQDVVDIDFVDEKDAVTPGNGSISGVVEEDTNADGTADGPLAGVTVELVDSNGVVVATAITDAAGMYTFADVAPGDYTVVETNPAGYTSVTDSDGTNDDETAVTVGTDEDVTGISFLDAGPVTTPGNGTIAGVVQEDTDGDGAGDTPLAGVTVKLLDAAGNPVLDAAGNPITAVTDANGAFLFADVAPGDYLIMETNPAGFTSIADTDGTNDDMTAVTVGADDDVAGIDFVDEKDAVTPGNGSISGVVEEDTDGDGMGDTPLAGVTVKLLDAAGNPVLDANGTPITAVTDGSGAYTFSNVAPGDYLIMETNPAGFTSIADTDGTNDDMTAVTVGTDEDVAGINFVDEEIVTTPGNGSIEGTVLEDTDGNGTGDAPLAGVTVVLYDATGNVVATTVTDGNGDYVFADIAPGTYTVAETDPTGFTSISDTDGGDSNETSVILGADEHLADIDFVDAPAPVVGPNAGSISGIIQEDTDGDSVGDTPISGVTVVLLDSMGNPVLDAAGNAITAVTDASGAYTFTGVAPGDYQVVEMDPAGFTSVSDTDMGDNNITNVTVGDDENVTGVNFTDEKAVTNPGNGSIAGTIDIDTDGDGTGDTGLGGVTVKLLDTAGNPVLDGAGNPITTVTDGSGNYHFADITPGDYIVMEDTPIGYSSVSDTDGNNDGMTAVTVVADQAVVGINFTDEEIANGGAPGSITGSVQNDTDGDGAGDAPLAGVSIDLVDAAGNVIATTMTDASGNYTFTNVAPGTYTVVEHVPAGYTSINDSDAGDNTITNVTVGDGENVSDLYFTTEATNGGNAGNPGTITGSVQDDTDGDGAGDTPLAGVSIDLVDANGTVIATTMTDASGNYTFTNVAPGTYTVVEHDPAGATSVNDSDGGDNNVTTVTVGDGENVAGIYFTDDVADGGNGGNPGTITGSVAEDTDGNNTGDVGLAGVSVDLVDAAGSVIATVMTDASGIFTFTNVAPGTYTVVEHDPAGFTSVNDSDAGDTNVTNVTVGDGENVTDIYFTDEKDGGNGAAEPTVVLMAAEPTVEQPTAATQTVEQPTVATRTVATQTAEQPTVATQTAEQPTVATPTAEQPTVATPTAEQPTVATQTAEQPTVATPMAELTVAVA